MNERERRTQAQIREWNDRIEILRQLELKPEDTEPLVQLIQKEIGNIEAESSPNPSSDADEYGLSISTPEPVQDQEPESLDTLAALATNAGEDELQPFRPSASDRQGGEQEGQLEFDFDVRSQTVDDDVRTVDDFDVRSQTVDDDVRTVDDFDRRDSVVTPEESLQFEINAGRDIEPEPSPEPMPPGDQSPPVEFIEELQKLATDATAEQEQPEDFAVEASPQVETAPELPLDTPDQEASRPEPYQQDSNVNQEQPDLAQFLNQIEIASPFAQPTPEEVKASDYYSEDAQKLDLESPETDAPQDQSAAQAGAGQRAAQGADFSARYKAMMAQQRRPATDGRHHFGGTAPSSFPGATSFNVASAGESYANEMDALAGDMGGLLEALASAAAMLHARVRRAELILEEGIS